MGLFRIMKPNAYGGANIHTVPEPVKVLASTFRRTPGSIVSKLLNLRGARANGAASEPKLFQELSDSIQLAALSKVTIDAARDEGFMADRVPNVWSDQQSRPDEAPS